MKNNLLCYDLFMQKIPEYLGMDFGMTDQQCDSIIGMHTV